MSSLVVAALGGNALQRRGEPLTEDLQRRNIRAAAESLAGIASGGNLVITHGNGPQIGLLALEAEAYREVPPYGLDVLGAESQGMIGYLLQEALRNALPGRAIATLLTTVEVSPADSAFSAPAKPIGPVYPEAEGRRLSAERGWPMVRDGGGLRRVVPSPQPLAILEIEAARVLVDASVLLICAGGGGVPVARGGDGRVEGIEGVIDKDLASALLAIELGASVLLLLTDVAAVELGWGTPAARAIDRATAEELRRHEFAPGTMAPKVEAACRFVTATGGRAAIGRLDDAAALLEGRTGTQVTA